MKKKMSKQCSVCQNNQDGCWSNDDSKCIRHLPKENTNLIRIQGIVETPPGIDTDVFSQMFMTWIESLGYIFCGGLSPEKKE